MLETTPSAVSGTPHRARRDERGASAVEYGLLIAGIAAVIVMVVYAFGGQVDSLFQGTCDTVQAQRGADEC